MGRCPQDGFQWECRGQVVVKGAGDMAMVTYLLH